MVLEVQSIPSIIIDHKPLPLVDDSLQRRHLPWPWGELAMFSNVHVVTRIIVSEFTDIKPLAKHTFQSGRSCSALPGQIQLH